jgi:dTDP-4-dehydrorhamnose reductase
MRILITGAGGQLGRALIRTLRGHEVTALRHCDLDITDREAVGSAIRFSAPELVVNAAAYNDVDGAETHIEAAEAINIRGPRILAEESAAKSITIVHVSTDYVFDGTAGRPYHEDDQPNPLSAYGRSKRAGEIAVIEANPRHYVVRTAWLFEANGKNFLNAMLAVAERTEVRVVADQFGSPTYAPHLARAIASLIGESAFGLYHLAGRGGVSRHGLVRELYTLLGAEAKVIAVNHDAFPAAAVRPLNTVLSTIKDSAPVMPAWQEGVREFVADLRNMAR